MFSVRAVALIVASIFPASAAPAQQRTPDVVVEAVLTRSLLERAAFHACAPLQPQPADSTELVARTWRLDMKDTADFLLKAGYPKDYVGQLTARLDLAKATPK